MLSVRKIISRVPVLNDLGIGERVGADATKRILRRNGKFNMDRVGLSLRERFSPYHFLLGLSWTRFYLVMILAYLVINALFAVFYTLLGSQALTGSFSNTLTDRFANAFFFSVQTFTTVGYGTIGPASLGANILATFESFTGLLGFALATGITFARFSRPNIQILYSDKALIAPYCDGYGFMFRIANKRNNELVELKITVTFTNVIEKNGRKVRHYEEMKLERDSIHFFPLSWTLVHPIDKESPLWDKDPNYFEQTNAEILILLTGFDETFSQTIYTRSSYQWNEWVWNARYKTMYVDSDREQIAVDLSHIHDYDILPD